MSLHQNSSRWVSHLPHHLRGRHATLRSVCRRACRTCSATAVEVCHEGTRSVKTHSRNKISRNRDRRQLFLSQTDYIGRVLERFNMQLAKSASTPLPINLRLSQRDCPTFGSEGEGLKSVPYAPTVGALMYAMVVTWPDIAHAVGVVSRFMHNPSRSHWNAVNILMSWCCCYVEKSGLPQRLQAYRRLISLRSGMRHFKENRPREDIYRR